MTSADMGFEAALNLGLPPAAAARPAGADATASRGAGFRADRTMGTGPACFRAALRAAAQKDPAGPPDSSSRPETPARVAAKDGEPAAEADSPGCVDSNERAKSAEPPVDTPARDDRAIAGCPWTGPLPAAPPSESSTGRSAEGSEDAGGGPTVAAAAPREWTELLDLLDRLQESLAGDSADAAALMQQIGERLESFRPSGEAGTDLPADGIRADLLSRLRDALSAAAPESSLADETDSWSQPPPAVPETDDPAIAGPEGPGVRRPIAAADILPAVRRVLALVREADGALPNPSAAAADDGAAPTAPAGTTAGLTAALETTDASAGSASPLPANPPSEGSARKGAAAESFRLAEAEDGRNGAPALNRHESSAEPDDFRQSPDDVLYSKRPATPAPAAGEGEARPDAFTITARETHPSAVTESGLEKTAGSPSASRNQEAMTGTGRTGIFDQIVQRAAVQLKNDQSEINIDLKPDFLGRVRMQILTENQQVTVRIVTELAAVRDMIEAGLNQLKSELQNQGLHVERLEVAVADDHRQQGWRQANPALVWKTAAAGGVSAMERLEIEERSAALYYRPRSSGAAGIDMFV